MLPTSNLAPINLRPDESFANSKVLADAFAEFSVNAGRLEKSYQDLQKEVMQLRATLDERNQALYSSQAENAEIKVALRRIVDALPCGVLVIDGEGHVILINPEANHLLGLPENDVTSLADTPLSGHASLQSALHSTSSDETEDQICIASPSNSRWLAVRSRKLSPPAANGIRVHDKVVVSRPHTVLILRDTTIEKRLESDREKARNSVALAEMSAVLGHEIRNPLASLELFVNLLEEQNGSNPEYVSQLRAGIRSLSTTVNNVLRIYSGGSLPLVPIVVSELLNRTIEFVRPVAAQKQIQLSFADSTEGVSLAGNEHAIQQLVANLSVNAFRHTPSGGNLKVVASLVRDGFGPRVRIEFCDSGCGIAAESLPHLFEAGFSVSGQTPGLGLAVCRQIVEQLGGNIRVKSDLGTGSTFTVELPAL